MTDIHFIIGSTGAGKTTYARKLATSERALPFSIDEWMRELFAPDLAGASFAVMNQRVERARRQMWDVAEKAHALGVASIFDTGLLTRASRAQAQEEAARRDLEGTVPAVGVRSRALDMPEPAGPGEWDQSRAEPGCPRPVGG